MDEFLTPEYTRVAWVVLGVFLIVAEFIVPGAVIIFFGVSAIITGLMVALGVITGLMAQFFFWLIVSLGLVLALRGQIRRWFPALESYTPYDESDDLVGTVVDVVEEILPDADSGRVRFKGTTWKAISKGSIIGQGGKAKITGRNNLILYVEAVNSQDLP